jgi:predicted nuclease of restriction endonuclease-like RecB superfamily
MGTLRNKFEKKINRQLEKAKVTFSYESERIPYYLVCHYIPDFIVHTPTGTLYIECKGYLRPEDKRKLIAVKRLNPHMDLRILYFSNNKKNTKWAERHGFKYAVSNIPPEWLRGM